MKATVFDYGAGNLHSLVRALAKVDVETDVVTDLGAALTRTKMLILPGVGAFGLAAERLAPWREETAKAITNGLPCIGICLGMQLFFDTSDEGEGSGLGIVPGKVTRLAGKRVPHIGWTAIEREGKSEYMYFAHSFACRPDDVASATAWATHEGERFAAEVRTANALGLQFHPEKSSKAGLERLARAVDEVAK
ncbi:MAG TPA: imidazole glycerol phosphate synthase subunit HisH [Polyangiaceae bacterium]